MTIYDKLIPRVVSWYAENKRDLPWRKTRDPYRIWVSEIMLQQTRVEAVIPYYERFLHALPDIASLAACPDDALLKLWEGLGYYSRVRNMREAARFLVAESEHAALTDNTDQRLRGSKRAPKSGPHLPKEVSSLLQLPGIGRYTAGAIASIAYGEPVPAVDGNVLRILARVMVDPRDIQKAAFRREAEEGLEKALRAQSAGNAHSGKHKQTEPATRSKDDRVLSSRFNQGMMDLGATVCLPNAQPRCAACPLSRICRAHKEKRELEYPVRSKTKARRIEKRTILLIRDGERVILTRRPVKGLLASLLEFPNLEGWRTRREVLGIVEEKGFDPLQIQALPEARHIFSHVEWHMKGFEIRIGALPQDTTKDASDDRAPARDPAPNSWFPAEISEMQKRYPIPSAYRTFAAQLTVTLGTAYARKGIKTKPKER